MSDYRIETMTKSDWDQVCKIYRQGILTGQATFETETPTWDHWDASHLPFCRFVIRSDKKIKGWAALSAVSGRCVYAGVAETSVYVAANSRGEGVGSGLLEALVAGSENNGIWTLQAGVFPENVSSIRLHQKFGFREVGRRIRIGKLNNRWRDTLLLERRSKVVGTDHNSNEEVQTRSKELTGNNEAIIRRLYEEIDKGNLAVVDECFASGYTDHNLAIAGLAQGREGARQAFQIFYAAFPDTQHVIQDLIVAGDKVVARVKASGTHTGELMGHPATGRRVELTGIAIYRFVDGRIAERWAEEPKGGVLGQLGPALDKESAW